jgi:hypothetical protein
VQTARGARDAPHLPLGSAPPFRESLSRLGLAPGALRLGLLSQVPRHSLEVVSVEPYAVKVETTEDLGEHRFIPSAQLDEPVIGYHVSLCFGLGHEPGPDHDRHVPPTRVIDPDTRGSGLAGLVHCPEGREPAVPCDEPAGRGILNGGIHEPETAYRGNYRAQVVILRVSLGLDHVVEHPVLDPSLAHASPHPDGTAESNTHGAGPNSFG